MMNASLGKRIVAFVIDMIILNIVLSIITVGIPNSRKYDEVKKDTENIVDEYLNDKISTKEAIDGFFENQYILEEESVPSNLIGLVITVGYFVLFAYYNKGQTLGKRFTHIKIVSSDGEDVSYRQLVGRTLIVNECFLTIISLLLIGFIKSNQYAYTIGLLGVIQTIVILSSIFMIGHRKDKKGIHDILFKTKVIEC